MKTFTILLLNFFFLSTTIFPQWNEISDLPRPDAAWESGYQTRLNRLYGSKLPYNQSGSCSGEDAGKWTWHPLLADMKTYPQNMNTYINGAAQSYLNSTYCGTFYKAFTCPGMTFYYFRYKDSIAKYDPDQLTQIENNVYNSWKYMFSQDHLFDRCCGYNTYGGKEFNSENFHWMYRGAGYLFAHEFHDPGTTGRDNTDLSVYIYDYDGSYGGSTINNINAIEYFDGFVDNLSRALYSSGRVEWNSNNYWGHTFTPVLTMYEGAEKCKDPNGTANKKKIKAILDWMTLETAIHYIDGFNCAPDARAKANFHLPFSGSARSFNYAYFADDTHHPTYPSNIWDTEDAGISESGIMLSSDYRPSSVIIDIAQRTFPLPVEIQRAIPFYHADFGNYFDNGEHPYHNWKGDDYDSRRFEFETIWMDKNYILTSAAVGRPDGNIGTFSEEGMWCIGVKGNGNGAVKITGNAGTRSAVDGRFAYEQIGQYRNIMARAIKYNSSTYNKMYTLIPDASLEINSASASGSWFSWDGYSLFVDLGNDVYMALIPSSNCTGISAFDGGNSYSKIEWIFPQDVLGALITEMGTKDDFGSFINFKSSIISNSTFAFNNDSTFNYTGASGYNIKMTHTGTRPYQMTPNTYDYQSVPNGGYYPKVWGDGNYIDYQNWDSYKTVLGHPVVNQKWGSSEMFLCPGDTTYWIDLDPTTANVTIYKSGDPYTSIDQKTKDNNIIIYPNPSKDEVSVRVINNSSNKLFVSISDVFGREIKGLQLNSDITEPVINKRIDISDLSSGLYLVTIKEGNKVISNNKLIVE